jgi:glycosyltransferase involved in cell wall biosynthesis
MLKTPVKAGAFDTETLAILKATTLIIAVRFEPGNDYRIKNINILLNWLEFFYGNTFDILIIEQDTVSRIPDEIRFKSNNIRYEFIYNPSLFNRGWAYNVAVKHHCLNARVVVLMDTDVLPGAGFLQSIINCYQDFHLVAPYRNIYYTNATEVEEIILTLSVDNLSNISSIGNPVTITGGVAIIRRDLFLDVCGFEQYTGYGGEDRALDVTLLNHCKPNDIKIAYEVYVHLYHTRESIDKSNTSAIMAHLWDNYRCKYHPDIKPEEYIHSKCTHMGTFETTLNYVRRSDLFGDPSLYQTGKNISINGLVLNADFEPHERLIPIINSLIMSGKYSAAAAGIYEALKFYKNTALEHVLENKLSFVNCKLEDFSEQCTAAHIVQQYLIPTFDIVDVACSIDIQDNISLNVETQLSQSIYKDFILPASRNDVAKHRILCAVVNHNCNENANILATNLSKYFDTIVIDSGSTAPFKNFFQLDNIYYSGLLNVAYEIACRELYDKFLFICSDVQIDIDQIDRLVERLRNLDFSEIGVYAPSSTGRVHIHCRNAAMPGLKAVPFVEGFIFIAKIEVLKEFLPVDLSLNRLGWGLDIATGYFSRKSGHLVVIDEDVEVYHPFDTGYSNDKARVEMVNWFKLHSSSDLKRYFFSDYSEIDIDAWSRYKVSIIIPCYNQAVFLWEAVKSVLLQNFTNVEIIIVNDGSTDDTSVVGKRLSSLFSQILYIEKENGGLSSARNAGLSVATGTHVQFLDADDFISFNKFSSQLINFKAGADVSYSEYLCFKDGDKSSTYKYSRLQLNKDPLLDFIENWETDLSIPMHCFLYDKECLEGVQFDETLPNHEDWDFHLKIAMKGLRYSYSPDSIAYYRVRTNSMCRDRKLMQLGLRNCMQKSLESGFLNDLYYKKMSQRLIETQNNHYQLLENEQRIKKYHLLTNYENASEELSCDMLVDFVFIPHKKYHTDTIKPILIYLQNRGFNFVIINPSPPHNEENAFSNDLAEYYISYNEFIAGNILPGAIVCFNDWDLSLTTPLLQLANRFLIPTIAICEGVNDYFDIDIRQIGWNATYRNAYRTVSNVLLNSDYDAKYFINSDQNIFVVGIGRLDNLLSYQETRKSLNNFNGRIVINSNFSYDVEVKHKSGWLNDIIQACSTEDLEIIISRHPQDGGDIPENIRISERSLYDEILECEMFISRFSGAILEALYIGVPVIYYPSAFEKADKFHDSMGGYLVAYNREQLRDAIRFYKNGGVLNSTRFLQHHTSSMIHGNSSDLYQCSLLTSNVLANIIKNDYPCVASREKFVKILNDFGPFEWAKQHATELGGLKIPPIPLNEFIVISRCINVRLSDIKERIIYSNDELYYIDSKSGGLQKRHIEYSVWIREIQYLSNDLIVYVTDIDVTSIRNGSPCSKLPVIQKELKPGVTFLIRAKNESENVSFLFESLRAVLNNCRHNANVVFVDNGSTDDTYAEVYRYCNANSINNIFLYQYNFDVSRSGDEHTTLKDRNEMHRSLDTYYNWCLDKVDRFNVIKWDADFVAITDNLIELIESYNLANTNKNIAIWFSGKTLYENWNEYFLYLDTHYNEFRVFSKLNGFKWEYAPRWEIISQDYLSNSSNFVFSKVVFFELKSIQKNEFEHRTGGEFITTCPRDRFDFAMMEAIQNRTHTSVNSLNMISAESSHLLALDLHPLEPTSYDLMHKWRKLISLECTYSELDSMQGYWLNQFRKNGNEILFQYSGNIIIQGLWIGNRLTDIHRMCVESFIRLGHCFILYTYDKVENLPDEVVVMDASKIVPESLIYQFNGSYAGFSDLFRNKLLFLKGGWYVDLDIYCLQKYDLPNEVILSLDHYPESDPEVFSKSGVKLFPFQNNYYCATNPVKLPKSHPMAEDMFAVCFRKIVLGKIFIDIFQSSYEISIDYSEIEHYVFQGGYLEDFVKYLFDPCNRQESICFDDFLLESGLSREDVGQRIWNEIGPRLVTEKMIEFGLETCAFEPEYFQGFIPYSEVEKYIDPAFDYQALLSSGQRYSIDLFFTMWKTTGILQKKDKIENTLYKYLEGLNIK